MAWVVSLVDVQKAATPLVGGKAANLGELIQGGFPVPPGFAVTTDAFRRFLEHNHLVERRILLAQARAGRQRPL